MDNPNDTTALRNEILEKVTKFNRSKQKDHHRYKSWEHCYSFFTNDPKDIDLAALHLAFYLASWGMYRGSSFLLQNDYKIHIPVVEIILNHRHLSAPTLEMYNNSPKFINDLFKLMEKLKQFYINKAIFREGKPKVVSDTLVTKILLGTLGCIPAYDRFFMVGLESKNIPHSTLSEKSFGEMLKFCSNNIDAFDEARKEVPSDVVEYPIMKIVDMYFWQLGEEKERKKREQRKKGKSEKKKKQSRKRI